VDVNEILFRPTRQEMARGTHERLICPHVRAHRVE